MNRSHNFADRVRVDYAVVNPGDESLQIILDELWIFTDETVGGFHDCLRIVYLSIILIVMEIPSIKPFR